MLFLLFKNAQDSSYSSVILFDTGIGDAYKESSIKSFGGKRLGAQEALISDFYHSNQFKKVILINETNLTLQEAVFLFKKFICSKYIQHANYMNNSNQ